MEEFAFCVLTTFSFETITDADVLFFGGAVDFLGEGLGAEWGTAGA